MKALLSLRAVGTLHAVVACLQPILAGLYLSGSGTSMALHQPVGFSLPFIALLQVAAAIVFWRVAGPVWPIVFTVVLLLCEAVQINVAFSRLLVVHIPLGVGVVVATVLFAEWTFGASARTATRAVVVA
jgi:hypothetical protein